MNNIDPTIILRKKKSLLEFTQVIKPTKNSNNINTNDSGKKIENTDDIIAPILVGIELGKTIIQARMAKNLKQTDVAKMINMPLNLYQSYENGTAIKNGANLNLIGSKLNVKLTGKN